MRETGGSERSVEGHARCYAPGKRSHIAEHAESGMMFSFSRARSPATVR
jgi:hypothetical protein